MNASPATTSPDTPLAEAIELMRDARSDSLPVVSGGRLVGIVTSQDVLAVLARMLNRGVLGEQGRSDTKIPCSDGDPTPRPSKAA
jgi:CBS domain-containing protein